MMYDLDRGPVTELFLCSIQGGSYQMNDFLLHGTVEKHTVSVDAD